MTLAIVLIVLAALSLIFILRVTLSWRLQISAGRSLAAQIQPIDVAAFRNLTNPAEDAHLRRRLPSAEFRAVRRERLRAMAAYVRTAARNAAVLARMGQIALAATASDTRTAEAARKLVDDAALLRQNCALALFRIHLALAWPNSGLAAEPVLERYEQLNSSAMLLGRLQNPAAPVRIAATF
jgi:hypothetical protein